MKPTNKISLLLIVAAMLFLGNSCRVLYPNMMFRTTKKQLAEYNDTITQAMRDPYVINEGDRLEFQIFSNRGMKLVDFGFSDQRMQQAQNVEYVVQQNGYVLLPLIDSLKLTGLTIKEATELMQEEFKEIVHDPFIFLNIKNWRVLMFRGIGEASVIPIQDRYVNLIDLLAQVNGIPEGSKSYNIKVIRGDLQDPIIWKVNLQTMKSIQNSNLEIRANDIIYLEPVINVPTAFVNTITPYLTLFSTYLLIRTLTNSSSTGVVN